MVHIESISTVQSYYFKVLIWYSNAKCGFSSILLYNKNEVYHREGVRLKRLLTFVLVVVLTIGVIGCESQNGSIESSGNETSKTISTETTDAEPDDTEQIEYIPWDGPNYESDSEQEITEGSIEYPGSLVYNGTWETENKSGFVLREQFRVWEPSVSGNSFKHPQYSHEVIPDVGSNNSVIPFEYQITNISEGFSGAKYDFSIGFARYRASTEGKDDAYFSGTNAVYDAGRSASVEFVGEKNGGFSLKTVVINNGGMNSDELKLIYGNGELQDGETNTIYGYFIFLESTTRTPNYPDGSTRELMDYVSPIDHKMNHCLIIAGTLLEGLDRPILSITKNDAGELIIGREFEWIKDRK